MIERLETLRSWRADVAVILGSGLSSLAPDAIDSVPYSEFAEIPKPSAPGHRAVFALGELGGVRVIFAQGRVHLYERRTAGEVTSIVRVLSNGGVSRIILTNAAGALNKNLEPGDWMMITDHLNLTGTSPLLASTNFLDLSQCYSPGLQRVFVGAAKRIGLQLRRGVYAGVSGPQYETPAEARMLRRFGADAVGMSTVLEAIQARSLGMDVAAFSCITNMAGAAGTTLSHEEVLSTAEKSADAFARLLSDALPRLA